MSARLEAALARASADGGCGLVPYLTAGDGGYAATLGALEACAALHLPAVELGLPFSEPVADGPTLIAAARRALEGGATFEGALACVRAFRSAGHGTPLFAFAYTNALFSRGLEPALEALAAAGFDGLMVPDLPFEESAPVAAAARRRGLALVQFAAPTTGPERLTRIATAAEGFLYLVARTGTTGRASAVDDHLLAAVGRARAAGARRVGVGFGLRTPEQLRALRGHADLAVVGSALVDHLHRAVAGRVGPDEAGLPWAGSTDLRAPGRRPSEHRPSEHRPSGSRPTDSRAPGSRVPVSRVPGSRVPEAATVAVHAAARAAATEFLAPLTEACSIR